MLNRFLSVQTSSTLEQWLIRIPRMPFSHDDIRLEWKNAKMVIIDLQAGARL